MSRWETGGTVEIREATKDDTPALVDIIRRSFRDVAERFGLTSENCPKHPSNCEESWIVGDMGKGVKYYVLRHESQLVGCVALEGSEGGACFLERLAVLPGSRKKGFGEALVHHVLREAGRRGFTSVGIGIISDDRELGSWYERHGFTETGTKIFRHLPFQVTFMSRRLERRQT